MSLLAFGVNHHSASLAVRERLSFSPDDIPAVIDTLQRQQLADEIVMLSTCNRSEFYLTNVRNSSNLLGWLSDSRQISASTLKKHAYLHREEAASKHLFRVATGLDSLALGEPQILGQIKSAYQLAVANRGVKKTLNRLFQEAFYVAKNVRSDTRLGENSISVVYTSIKLTEQFFSRYENLTALVIGAGKTGELAVKELQKKGVGRILVANRSLSKAQHLALSANGYAMNLEQLPSHLHEADIIISATGRGEYTVKSQDLAKGKKQRHQRMQVLLDLAVPRDIDAKIRKLPNSYLFSIDDLQTIIDKNQALRDQAAQRAEALIDDYNQHFHEWLQLRQHHRLIKGVHEMAQMEKERLTQQAIKRLENGEDAHQVIQELATRLTKKLTHQPSLLIRQAGEKRQTEVLEAIKSIYHFD